MPHLCVPNTQESEGTGMDCVQALGFSSAQRSRDISSQVFSNLEGGKCSLYSGEGKKLRLRNYMVRSTEVSHQVFLDNRTRPAKSKTRLL